MVSRTYAKRRRKLGGTRKRSSPGASRSYRKAKRTTKKVPVRKIRPNSGRKSIPQKATDELSVFHDPFSKKCQQPRIPDGKATASLGTRVQAVASRAVNHEVSNSLEADVMHVILFPGVSSNVLIFQTPKALFGGNTAQKRDFEVLGFEEHAPFRIIADGLPGWPDRPGSSSGIKNNIEIRNSNQIAKWRLVSSGLQMQLVNNDETNDGWFEMVRINNAMSTEDYMLTTMNNYGESYSVICPSREFVQGIANATNLVQEPSYSTGLLKDINHHLFSLHPTTDNVEFKTLFEEYKLVNTLNDPEDVTLAYNDIIVETDEMHENQIAKFNATARARELIEKMLDMNHDMIYIRIHGRSSGGSTAASSKLLFHSVANYEVMYDSTSELSKFMIKGENHPKMDAHYQAKKSNVDASEPVTKKMKVM